MTKGYKWKIFCVFLSYFYIIALTVLPLFNTFVCIPILDNALVEMYSLAATSRIIGTVASTYSMTAAAIGKIQLEVLEAETNDLNL